MKKRKNNYTTKDIYILFLLFSINMTVDSSHRQDFIDIVSLDRRYLKKVIAKHYSPSYSNIPVKKGTYAKEMRMEYIKLMSYKINLRSLN